ncbi:MAG: NAD(P)/FAD-dependent oxidoreductase [Candidatus Acidiferrales bacterium]
MEQANVVIIGGGVVGCAVARALSVRWNDIFVLEALPKIGMGTSSRNSGVIHSGLYYPPGSLKARHCVRGNQLTYEFCAAHSVPHRRIGKLVVASVPAETEELAALKKNGESNGVENITILDHAGIRAREPHVEGFQAIEVPSTGIVGSEELVKAYARTAADQGAHIVVHARAEQLEPTRHGVRIASTAGEIEARCMVNSAGLFADEVAGMLGSAMAAHKIYPVRGEYCEFVRDKQDWIRGLVYPLPHPEGVSLGVHLTKTVWGGVLVGPTARYLDDKNNYERDREPIEVFARGAKLLLPALEPSDLVPAFSGIRAKLTPPGRRGEKRVADFVIERDPQFPCVIQLMGIESPGLTSAPSIAEHVRDLVAEILS